MKIIGLTGGSGVGKGTVAALLATRGAGWVNADAVYRTLAIQNHAMLAALQTAFGDVLTPNGALNRPFLAKIVFSDPEKLQQLNALTRPFIEQASAEAFMQLAQSGHTIILYDAPTLFETGLDRLCCCTIGVLAPRQARIERIIARDGLSAAAAAARINAQPDDSFYRARCTHILVNDGDFDALADAASALYDHLL